MFVGRMYPLEIVGLVFSDYDVCIKCSLRVPSRFKGKEFIQWNANSYYEGETQDQVFYAHDGDKRETPFVTFALGTPPEIGIEL